MMIEARLKEAEWMLSFRKEELDKAKRKYKEAKEERDRLKLLTRNKQKKDKFEMPRLAAI